MSATFEAASGLLVLGINRSADAGVPVLLTTEFHGKDEPIVETPHEALAAFRRLPLHALAMPPFLVTKRVEPALPA